MCNSIYLKQESSIKLCNVKFSKVTMKNFWENWIILFYTGSRTFKFEIVENIKIDTRHNFQIIKLQHISKCTYSCSYINE